MTFLIDDLPVSLPLPFLQKQNPDGSQAPLTPDMVKTPPPIVQAQLDATGAPLARWDGQSWVAVERRPQSSYGSTVPGKPQAATARHSPSLYNIAYGAVLPSSDGARIAGAIWGPWDGRYDSHWSLVANVLEFAATQNSDRAHIALRIYQKHRTEYEDMVGGPLPNFQAMDLASGKTVYPRHGSPTATATCWAKKPADCTDPSALPPTPAVRNQINEVFVNAGKALNAYMRRLRSNNSAYDRWLAGDYAAMSPAAQRGLRLFVGKAECVLCHNGPNFTDSQFHNLGVPVVDPEQHIAGSALSIPVADAQAACFPGIAPNPFCPDPGRNGWQVRAAGQCRVDTADVAGKPANCQRVAWPESSGRFDVAMDCRSEASDATDKTGDSQCLPATRVAISKCAYDAPAACLADPLCQWNDQAPARCVAIDNPEELGQFKTPTLRNVALTFPYMHNGALFDYGPAEAGLTTSEDPRPHLRRVIQFYAGGGGIPMVGTVSSQLRKLNLSELDVDDLLEFLLALTDNSLATENRDGLAQAPFDPDDLSQCPP
jgi:cytochrome c peroxidase